MHFLQYVVCEMAAILFRPQCVKGRAHRNNFHSLQWRHNDHGSVSNHQPNNCLLNRLVRGRSKKYQCSASLAFVWRIHWWPVNSPHKWPVTWKIFPFDDVIMWMNNYIALRGCIYLSMPLFQCWLLLKQCKNAEDIVHCMVWWWWYVRVCVCVWVVVVVVVVVVVGTSGIPSAPDEVQLVVWRHIHYMSPRLLESTQNVDTRGLILLIQWNLSITTTKRDISLPSGAHHRWAPEGRNC